jgi:hypothetical protein
MAMSDASSAAAIITALITAGASLAVALIAGGFAVWNANKTNKNSFDIQDFKSATDRDLERLKAKLEHGQLISSTQWNVEFTAYQAIWQALVTVRNDTMDIATYEQHLETLDLLAIVPDAMKLESVKDKAKSLDASLTQLSNAVQNNAPFYPPYIRTTAIKVINPLRGLATGLLAFAVAHKTGKAWDEEQLTAWRSLRNQEITTALTETETLEIAIRERLNTVRVIA